MQLTQRQVRLLLIAVDEYLDANEDLVSDGSSGNQERRDWADTKRLFTLLEKELLRTAKLSPSERVRSRTTITTPKPKQVLSESLNPGPLTLEQQERLKMYDRLRVLENRLKALEAGWSGDFNGLDQAVKNVTLLLNHHINHTGVKH